MKRVWLFVSGALILTMAGCDSRSAPTTRVQVYSNGHTAIHDNSPVLTNYGGHSLRIDDGAAVLRMYRIEGGEKTLELEYSLSSEMVHHEKGTLNVVCAFIYSGC